MNENIFETGNNKIHVNGASELAETFPVEQDRKEFCKTDSEKTVASLVRIFGSLRKNDDRPRHKNHVKSPKYVSGNFQKFFSKNLDFFSKYPAFFLNIPKNVPLFS